MTEAKQLVLDFLDRVKDVNMTSVNRPTDAKAKLTKTKASSTKVPDPYPKLRSTKQESIRKKASARQYQRKWAAKNPDKIKKNNVAYYQRHKTRIRAISNAKYAKAKQAKEGK